MENTIKLKLCVNERISDNFESEHQRRSQLVHLVKMESDQLIISSVQRIVIQCNYSCRVQCLITLLVSIA